MISFDEALRIAREYVDSKHRPMSWRVRRFERPAGWVFNYQTKSFTEAIKRGATDIVSLGQGLLGNAPFIVFAETSEVSPLSGDPSMFNAMLREIAETGQWDHETKKRDFPYYPDWVAHAEALGLTKPVQWVEEFRFED